jgi:NTP pyrophosphatase (non-canonical NTP hydrolase)
MNPTQPVDRLIAIMARLRDPKDGCPWDLEQSFRTILPYTLEEAYEVAEAIEREDMAALRDELGDLLLQVVFHARMAEEGGHFAFADVVEAICDKLIRRHPHVFGAVELADSAAILAHWEQIKAAERAGTEAGEPSGILEASRARCRPWYAPRSSSAARRESGSTGTPCRPSSTRWRKNSPNVAQPWPSTPIRPSASTRSAICCSPVSIWPDT